MHGADGVRVRAPDGRVVVCRRRPGGRVAPERTSAAGREEVRRSFPHLNRFSANGLFVTKRPSPSAQGKPGGVGLPGGGQPGGRGDDGERGRGGANLRGSKSGRETGSDGHAPPGG